MSPFSVTWAADTKAGTRWLVPGGCVTPQAGCVALNAGGASVTGLDEAWTGQRAWLVVAQTDRLALTWHFDEAQGADYPEGMFRPRGTRFTRFADALLDEVAAIAPGAPEAERARAIACHTAERFTYGHPETRFNDGLDAIPALGCGLTEGSCVDINTYFIAALRAAGIAAGYVTGFFFPAEKRDWCSDGHCWVVTRIGGQTQEWDIAHHLKMGRRDIAPGLNPKPGFRAAVFHSMGLEFPQAGVTGAKALIEPNRLEDGRLTYAEAPEIRLLHPAIPKREASA